jgi:hypothetical protein
MVCYRRNFTFLFLFYIDYTLLKPLMTTIGSVDTHSVIAIEIVIL